MENIKTEISQGILLIKLARGKANALNSAMVDELGEMIRRAETDRGVSAIVLASDRPKFFSGGFDVKEVFGYERDAMTEFFGRFIDLYESMLLIKKPVVAAVSGHAYAGGAVLALASDARVMAGGEFGFALNEINIGLVLPPGMMRMAVRATGPAVAREMVVEGKVIAPAEALAARLASEVTGAEAVIDRAVARASELAAKPPETFGKVKRLFNEALGLPPARSDREFLAQFIEHWFSAESIEHKQRVIDSLRR
ncbi:MAG TPA: enoyl-CoA hydratase/isomerase family protein [Blastocatellia bacterium]|jgi:enoyl-CoA hydratase/carnithine racemase